VAKLFTNDGRGIADLLSAKATATSTNSVLTKETSLTTNEITSLNSKKAAMTKAMTARPTRWPPCTPPRPKPAPARVDRGGSTGTGTLFDMLG
jgi:flagellar hook-associated protein 2